MVEFIQIMTLNILFKFKCSLFNTVKIENATKDHNRHAIVTMAQNVKCFRVDYCNNGKFFHGSSPN